MTQLDMIKLEFNTKINEILSIKEKKKLRKPIVIEFCGSPKSGKTTCIEQLKAFFKKNGIAVTSVMEKASISPIKNKHSPDFNMWTLFSTVSDLMEFTQDNNYEIIFIDRGLFDSLCWFEWLKDKKILYDQELKKIHDFVLMKRWIKNIDLVFIFDTEPDISIARDQKHLLLNDHGSIMNHETLKNFNNAVLNVKKEYGSKFSKIIHVDSNTKDLLSIVSDIGKEIIIELNSCLYEKVGYLKGYTTDNIMKDVSYGLNEKIDLIRSHSIMFEDRKEVEQSNHIQLIPIAIIMDSNNEKILVNKKNNDSLDNTSPEKNKYLLWIGGHIRKEDQVDSYSTMDTIKNALEREIKEELGIEYALYNIDEPKIIYTPSNEKSKKHMALCFIISVNENTVFNIDEYELLPQYGNSRYGKFHSINEIADINEKDFEEWSNIIGYKILGWENHQIQLEEYKNKKTEHDYKDR